MNRTTPPLRRATFTAGALMLAALAGAQESAAPVDSALPASSAEQTRTSQTGTEQTGTEQTGQEGGAPKTEPQETDPREAGAPPPTPEQDETDLRGMNPFAPPGGAGGPEDIEQLFLKVEKRLQRVTDLLYEASSGDVSGADDIGSAGIDELIREAEQGAAGASSGMARILGATRSQSEATLDDIQTILEMAEQQSSSSSSSSSQSQSPSSQGTPQQGQTPSNSRKQESGERPPEPGEGEEQQGEPGDGQQPRGSQESDAGEDGQADAPPLSETGGPSGASGAEEWGDLPVHLRKVFQNGVSEDVPPRYRDWVDSYYKRLNKGGKR